MKMVELCGGPVDGQIVSVRPGLFVYVVPVRNLDSARFTLAHPDSDDFRRAVYDQRPKNPQRFDFKGYDE
jgi:hypothetical protein